MKKILIWSMDRRGGVQPNDHFIFIAKFKKGNDIPIRVNAEFKTKEKAEKQAIKYAKIVGQIPYFLKENIFKVNIHKGNKLWGGGNRITIHTGAYQGKWKRGYLFSLVNLIMHK